MNILVIGNGFDLAHGLPTKYGDFLEFYKKVSKIYTLDETVKIDDYAQEDIWNWNMDLDIKKILLDAFDDRIFEEKYNWKMRNIVTTSNKVLDEFYNHTKKNIWMEYFLKCESYVGENWIDFEAEISKIIQILDEARFLISSGVSVIDIQSEKKEILSFVLNLSEKTLQNALANVKEIDIFIGLLSNELERLIRALEIYIVEFINKIALIKKNVDIKNITPNCVLSFNYSNTYERLYNKGEIEYDYIHGKADINNTIESNNMVLGIDEYLPIDRKDKEISFIAFKKYYQRIYKGTGCEYKDWMYTIKESAKSIESKLREGYPEQIPFIKFTNDARHNLYIFGHSLDVTDKDILRDLILNDNVYTKIFYFNKIDLASKIANLVKVIGQDELIRRSGGSTKTIEFKLQQDMVEQK